MFIHVCTYQCAHMHKHRNTNIQHTHTHRNVNFKTGKPADTSRCYKLAENSEQREESPGKEERTKAASRVHRQAWQAYFHRWTMDSRWTGRQTGDL